MFAAAELKKGGDDSEDEVTKDLQNLSDDETASDKGEGGAEEDWADEDENVGKLNPGPSKYNKKMLLSVDKVHMYIILSNFEYSPIETCCQLHAMAMDIFQSKSNTKRFNTLFTSFAHQNIVTLFPFIA